MASSSSQTSSEAISDLATLISNRITVDEEVLKLYAEKGQIDIPDKDGQTPLMLACWAGLEEVVKVLLANGANPNSKSLKDGNTPMHYACRAEDTTEEESRWGRNYEPKHTRPKVPIVKLLLSSGAHVQDNLNGWSPSCVAAFYKMKSVVDFFLAMDDDDIPLEEKIKAAEIFGVSQAILYKHTECKDAFHSFSQAISFQQGAGLPIAKSETSELAACFSKVSLQECHTQDELKSSIEQSEVALKAHAFLVGDRLFPRTLKQRYLYPSLAIFASFNLMVKEEMWEEGFQVLSCVLGFEHQGDLKLGSVASTLAYNCQSYVFREDEEEEPNDQYLERIRDLLCEYESVLQHVHIDSLSANVDSIIKSFSKILFNEAVFSSTVDILRSTLQSIEKSVRVIRSRIRRENPDKYRKMSSVTYEIMVLLEQILGSTSYTIGLESLLRVRFVILKILISDGASYIDSRGYTVLHYLAYYVSIPEFLEHLEDLARAFVRHGCPIDAVDMDGYTARDMLKYEGDTQGTDPLYVTLLSPPTTVLRLEEIAIRQILRHNVNYEEMLYLQIYVR